MKDLKPKLIIERLKTSAKAVFSGEATNQEFIDVFLAVSAVALIIVFFFILITKH